MKKTIQVQLTPKEAFDPASFQAAILKRAGVAPGPKTEVRMLKRSIDARSRQVKVKVQAEIYVEEPIPPRISYGRDYRHVADAKRVVIVGCGPAGMFAALRLIELGIKPVILERGSDVQKRRKDLAAINQKHVVNPESNYCFGEGGAGTYSDGKLYTRSKKRGDISKILEILVSHGASEDILIDAHPHIGTNRLPQVVEAMRDSILSSGGEIHFDTKVTDFVIEDDALRGVTLENGEQVKGEAVLLATGHSARDIYQLLHRLNIAIETKPFAIGVRVEHPQSLIDKLQYHCEVRGDYLPAAPYTLAHQTVLDGQQRGVFSFCMCPGGFIVPTATAPGEVVVNGMSLSRRDSKFANSGIVVTLELDDFQEYAEHGPLAGLEFQKEIEQKACKVAGGTQAAPAQRMTDFLKGNVSKKLNETSYQPGLVSVDMADILPQSICVRLREALEVFGGKMRGYVTHDAQLVGVESRTSSPVKIPRNKESCEHPDLKRFYPCGEGAGYAGGIVSAAMDGERCANQIFQKYLKFKANS